jgi:hypothetical protein
MTLNITVIATITASVDSSRAVLLLTLGILEPIPERALNLPGFELSDNFPQSLNSVREAFI